VLDQPFRWIGTPLRRKDRAAVRLQFAEERRHNPRTMRIDFISWLSATAFIACFLHRVFGRGVLSNPRWSPECLVRINKYDLALRLDQHPQQLFGEPT
jgi:hypothetical protein